MRGAEKPFCIAKKHFIFCEGKDAKNFLIQFFNSDYVKKEYPKLSEDIQVEEFGGNSELQKQLPLLVKIDGFDTLKSLLIIRDTEKSIQSAIGQIQSALQKTKLPVPKSPALWTNESSSRKALQVGFLLFPTCTSEAKEGQLEDLCLSIIKEKSFFDEEIDPFLHALKKKRNLLKFPKTQLHTYFSVTGDYVSLKIGEAAKAGAFDWSHEKLKSLINFIYRQVDI